MKGSDPAVMIFKKFYLLFHRFQQLTWDDLNDATWAVMGPTSASGYIYPSLWLNDGTVVGRHFVCIFLNGAVVTVFGIVGILVDGVAKCGKKNIAVIRKQYIVTA